MTEVKPKEEQKNKIYFEVIERQYEIVYYAFKKFRGNKDAEFSRSELSKSKIFEDLDKTPTESALKRDLIFLSEALVFEPIGEGKGKRYHKSDYLTISFSSVDEKLSALCRTIVSLLYVNPKETIKDSMVGLIIKSNAFNYISSIPLNDIVSDLIIYVHNHNNENTYNLLFLTQLIRFDSNFNIEIVSDDSSYKLNNRKLKKIHINDDGINLEFDKSMIYINDLSEIKSIERIDENYLNQNIHKLREVISEMDADDSKEIVELLENYDVLTNIFFQNK